MSRISKSENLINVHTTAIKDFNIIQGSLRDERLQCLQDRRFYSIVGAPWEGPLGDQYENRPKFEFNKIMLSVIRIFNEYRSNRIDVQYISKDGTTNDALSDACNDRYRSDEQDSKARAAYDNGVEEGIGGGFGAWRLRTVYEDEEDEENELQRIVMEPIYDADSSVFFDLNAKDQNKADAKCCFVLTSMTRDAYVEEWNDDPATWPKEIHQYEFDWATPDVVYIAEYYKVEEVPDTVYVYQNLDGSEQRYRKSDFEKDEELLDRLDAVGSVEIRQKKIKSRRVHKYIMSGSKVLEDCGYIAGKCIPIIPYYGKRWFIDNIERCCGHVRFAKDAQRLKNMQLSHLAEISAYSSFEKPIVTPQQMATHQVTWSEDNIRRNPYLLLNQTFDINGNPIPLNALPYTRSPSVPPALAALLQITEQDMQEILGNQQQGEQLQPNVSGEAINRVQLKIDMQAYIYISNFAVAIERTGEVWLSMAKEIYVEPGRKLKGISSQDKVRSIELMKPMISKKGEIEYENDFSNADFKVVVDVGPSSSSRREATVRALTNMLMITEDPETKQVLSSMIMMNMEGEGIGDVREYFRQKLLTMGVLKPTPEEAQILAEQAANKEPDPQSLYLQAAAQQAQAEAAEAYAHTAKYQADAQLTQAKTFETVAKIDLMEQEQALEIIDRFAASSQQELPPAPTVVVAEPLPRF